MRLNQEPTLSRGDSWSLLLFVVVGAALAIMAVVSGIGRLIELLSPGPVDVPADFTGTSVEAPIGPDGTLVTVELDRAILTVDALPVASTVAGVVEVLLGVAMTVIVILSLILLSRSLLIGAVFTRRNTRLVATAGIAWTVGYAGTHFFGNMVANGAFAVLSERTFDNVVLSLNVHVFLLGAFVAAFTAAIFAVGERLQHDQEGLV